MRGSMENNLESAESGKERHSFQSVLDTDVMYHYCSLEAFMGIITSKCLWMTSAAYTNDALEMNSINKCVQKVLENIYKHRDISFEEFKKKGEWYENNEKASMPFICCFSENLNNFSQWRLYADDCQGVAIAFNMAKLRDRLGIVDSPNILEEGYSGDWVHYISKDKEAELQSKIENEIEKYDVFCVNDIIRYVQNFFFKMDWFKDEKEIRIIYTPGCHLNDESKGYEYNCSLYNKEKFGIRAFGKNLIPYWKMPLNESDAYEDLAIDKVIVGSKVSDDTKFAIEMFLKKNKLNVSVEKFETSYR